MSIADSLIIHEKYKKSTSGLIGAPSGVKFYIVTTKTEVTKTDRGNGIIRFRGERMASVRASFGWTQGELADQMARRFPDAKVSAQTISFLEIGKRKPSIDVATAIAIVLETSLDFLMGLIEHDKALNGHDEVTIVVRTQEQKRDIQDIAYPFIDMSANDRRMVMDLVQRLAVDSAAVDATTVQEMRFRNVIRALADKLGADVVGDITKAFSASS